MSPTSWCLIWWNAPHIYCDISKCRRRRWVSCNLGNVDQHTMAPLSGPRFACRGRRANRFLACQPKGSLFDWGGPVQRCRSVNAPAWRSAPQNTKDLGKSGWKRHNRCLWSARWIAQVDDDEVGPAWLAVRRAKQEKLSSEGLIN